MNTFLLLFFSILCFVTGQVTTTNQNGHGMTCCPAPFSIYGLGSDLNTSTIFPGNTLNLTVVSNGRAEEILTIPGVQVELNLNTQILILPLLVGANKDNIQFNTTLTSGNTSVLSDPFVIPAIDTAPTAEPIRIQIIFDCVGIQQTAIVVTVNITLLDLDTRELYCPINFLFGKECREKGNVSQEQLQEFEERQYVTGATIPPYTVMCSPTVTPTPSNERRTFLILLLAGGVAPFLALVILCIAITLVCWLVRYGRLKKKHRQLLRLEEIGAAYNQERERWRPRREPHKKEFSPDKLELVRELGEGAFGTVYEGEARDILEEGVVTPVAVKQLRNLSAKEDFFREVSFMSKLDHERIIKLLGVCSQSEPFAMIIEYMDLGDLCSFLRDTAQLRDESSNTDVLVPSQLVDIAHQIAEGMRYIASVNLVHRDLAARNCLVSTGLVIKIGDFGLSRNLYDSDYYRVEGSTLLPIRWMAPECIQYGKFTEASDVYSFGVLLWETFTYGEQPYAGHSNEDIVKMITTRQYLVIPSNAVLGDVMKDCWQWKPKDRPSFNELCSLLKTILHDMKD